MTLENFRKKVASIEKTHPAPKGMEFPFDNFHYREIIDAWFEKLSEEDQDIISKEDAAFAEKMSS